MKRLIRSTIEFEDSILIDVEIPMPEGIYSSTVDKTTLFPGREQFQQDVLDILENEYHFEVVDSSVSNRPSSPSIYFDTYYTLEDGSARIHCFIHFRFSDHVLNDVGDTDHIEFLRDNARKYTENRQVDFVIKEEDVTISSKELYRAYDIALDDLRDTLESRIQAWTRMARRRANRR